MGNAVDFQKVRKRRQRVQTLKRLLILAGVALLLGAVILVNSLLIEEGVTTRIGDFVESLGGTGFPISTPGGVIRDVKHVGNNLAVLNDTNLYLYNKKGKPVLSLQQMTDNSVMLTNSSRVLAYQIGGRSYIIHTPSKLLLEREAEDNIIGAAMGEDGTYAVITTPKQYVARVTVYDKQFSELYRWNSAENLVLGAALSTKGNYLAVSTVNTNGGVIESTLIFFRAGQEVSRVSLAGELVLGMEFHGEDKLGVLTDQSFHIVNTGGSTAGSYSLGAAPVVQMVTNGSQTLLLTEYKESRTHTVVLLDASGKEVSSLTVDNTIRDMALGARRIYLLDDNGIHTYNHSLEEQAALEQGGISRIHLIGGRLHYFTSTEIGLLEDAATSKVDNKPGAKGPEERPEQEAPGDDAPPGDPEMIDGGDGEENAAPAPGETDREGGA